MMDYYFAMKENMGKLIKKINVLQVQLVIFQLILVKVRKPI